MITTKKKEMEESDASFAKKLAELDIGGNLNQCDISKDEEYAINILKEEKQKLELIKQQKAYEEELTKIKRMDDEYRKKLEDQDKELAIKIQQNENIKRNIIDSSSNPKQPPFIPKFQRKHILNIHNNNCFCGKTELHNNNHLYMIHNQHCNCSFGGVYNGTYKYKYPNHHKHIEYCCTLNHIHTIQCKCVNRRY